MDETGRIQIPQNMREVMHLKPKQPLELHLEDGELTLRQTSQGKIVEQDGMYVWTGATPDESLQEMIERSREERVDSILENI